MKIKILSVSKYFRTHHLIKVGQIYNVERYDEDLGKDGDLKGYLIKTKKKTFITMYINEVEAA